MAAVHNNWFELLLFELLLVRVLVQMVHNETLRFGRRYKSSARFRQRRKPFSPFTQTQKQPPSHSFEPSRQSQTSFPDEPSSHHSPSHILHQRNPLRLTELKRWRNRQFEFKSRTNQNQGCNSGFWRSNQKRADSL